MVDRRTFLLGSAAFVVAGPVPRLGSAAGGAPGFTLVDGPIVIGGDKGQAIWPNLSPRDTRGYHVVWSELPDDETERTVWYARRFDTLGTPETVVHKLNASQPNEPERYTAVVSLANGDALIFGSEGNSLIGRSLTAAGIGPRRVVIGSVGPTRVRFPQATRLADGNILVVWSQEKTYGRILTSTMNPVGKAFLIATGSGVLDSTSTSLAPLTDGGAVVALTITREDGPHFVVQRLRPGGGTVGAPLVPKRLAALRSAKTRIGVAGLADGGFALFWHGNDQFGGHLFTAAGTTAAQVATVTSAAESRAPAIPVAVTGSTLVVATATGGLTVAAFDSASGAMIQPFTTLSSAIGDTVDLRRLSDGTFVAATYQDSFTDRRQGQLQRFDYN